MRNAMVTGAAPNEIFDRIRPLVGTNTAIFILCAVENIPYRPEIAAETWDGYVKAARVPGKGFQDGRTDVIAALEDGEADRDRWRREWGMGDDEKPYSPADYRRLDEIFRTLTERQKGAGGYDAQQEYALRDCAKMSLIRENYLERAKKGGKEAKDHISMAKTLLDMIDARLKQEALRKADEKPQTAPKIDDLVMAMYKKHGLSMTMTRDEVMNVFAQWMNRKGIYAHTSDAAEHALMAIVNCTRGNSDQPPLEELPADFMLDKWGDEFAQEQSPEEQAVYQYFGEVPRGFSGNSNR